MFQELERQKHTCTVLQHKQEELKEGIRQRDELIEVNLKALASGAEANFPLTTLDGCLVARPEAAARVCRLQQRPSLCWSWIRDDQHWPGSVSVLTSSLCSSPVQPCCPSRCPLDVHLSHFTLFVSPFHPSVPVYFSPVPVFPPHFSLPLFLFLPSALSSRQRPLPGEPANAD